MVLIKQVVPGAKRDPQAFLDLTASQFAALSDAKATELLRVQAELNQQKTRHARWALVMGTLSYLASLGTFAYLVMNEHPKMAGLALSTSVLTVIKRILDNRT
jgi:hypothetical protein